VPYGRWETTNFRAAPRAARPTAPLVVDGAASNAPSFLALYVSRHLALIPRANGILDGCMRK
jgi:hypothetical protein